MPETIDKDQVNDILSEENSDNDIGTICRIPPSLTICTREGSQAWTEWFTYPGPPGGRRGGRITPGSDGLSPWPGPPASLCSS